MFITPDSIQYIMTRLICSKCGEQYDPTIVIWRCRCGGILDLEYSPTFPVDKIQARKPSIWRYREAIPILDDNSIISFEEGFTPMLEIDINGIPVLIKQEQLFSTGSYKDRGASVLVSKVRELGLDHVVEDSSGNAGCGIAAYCAAGGIKCDIYVPASTSINKLTQLEFYGANINRVPGNREETARAVQRAAEGNYYASHCWNPYFLHGTKTFAFEVCEQLCWKPPDALVVPVGNGTLLLGAYLGFNELLNSGVIDMVPQLIGVQAANCAPLAEAYLSGMDYPPVEQPVEFTETIAEGIAIINPVRGKQILEAVKKTNGTFITVSDQEIHNALLDIGQLGFYIEPTSAATIAGLIKYTDLCTDQRIVSMFTGHGLKCTEKMLKVLSL